MHKCPTAVAAAADDDFFAVFTDNTLWMDDTRAIYGGEEESAHVHRDVSLATLISQLVATIELLINGESKLTPYNMAMIN